MYGSQVSPILCEMCYFFLALPIFRHDTKHSTAARIKHRQTNKCLFRPLFRSSIVDEVKWALHRVTKNKLAYSVHLIIFSQSTTLSPSFSSSAALFIAHPAHRLFVRIQLLLIKFIFIEKYGNYLYCLLFNIC